MKSLHQLKTSQFNTKLGDMVAIGDDYALYLLEFADNPKLESKIQRLETIYLIEKGENHPILSIEEELNSYFFKNLIHFKTPIKPLGSFFQKQVWDQLLCVPYGNTISYTEQAKLMGSKFMRRAVAKANSTNPLAIIIPCHRAINSNGKIGGYSGGIDRKKFLIEHEMSW